VTGQARHRKPEDKTPVDFAFSDTQLMIQAAALDQL